MDSPGDLSPLSPAFPTFATEPSQNTPFHLQTFLRPSSKGQLKRPTYTQYAGRSRKLSNDDFNLKRKIESDKTSEYKSTCIPLSQSQNRKNFDFSPSKGEHSDMKKKSSQKVPNLNNGTTEPPILQTQVSFAQNPTKILLRSNTLTERQSKASNREKSPELKSLLNLKTGVADKVPTEEAESDIFSPGAVSRSSSRQATLMSIHANALRRRLLQRNTGITGTVALSNMIRRKSCHCSDCGGLSKFEKRHLNVVTMTKREEMMMEKNFRKGYKHTLADLDRKFERKSASKSVKSEKNSRVLMKLKPKFDAILNGVRDKVRTQKTFNPESLVLNKEKHARSRISIMDLKNLSVSHLEHSTEISHKPLASERLHEVSKASLNLIEESLSHRETENKETLLKEIQSAKLKTLKREADKISTMRSSLNEASSKKSPNKVFIEKTRQSQINLQKFVKKEEKKLVKRIDKRKAGPSKSESLSAKVLSKANEVISVSCLQIAKPADSSTRTANSKSREKLVIDTYNSNNNRKLVEEKNPTAFSATLQTKRMISIESLPKLDLGYMSHKEGVSSTRTEISSMHTKHFVSRNRLTLFTDRISGLMGNMGNDDSTSRVIKTDRDLFSIGDHSSKFSDYLGIKVGTEPNEESFRKSGNMVKINTERELKSAYRKQAKAYLGGRLQDSKTRYISSSARFII